MPRPQKVPFDKWTEEDVAKNLPKVREEYAANEQFIAGDHWQGGDGWIGPRPAVTDSGIAETMALIEAGFTSRDAIGEVVDRHANGVVGREPGVQFVPRVPPPKDQDVPEAQQQAAENARALLAEWWDRRKIAQTLWEFTATLCWAERAVLRIFIPSGLLVKAGDANAVDANGDLATALDFIYVMQPKPANAGVAIDPDTQQEVGIFSTEVEVGGQKKKVTELCYVPGLDAAETEDGVVILRQLGDVQSRTPLRTGGRLLIFQARRPLLITKSVQQNQKALNLAYSILPRNIVTGGFLERILLNARMPGSWKEVSGVRTWVPEPFKGGPGTVQFVHGIEEEDEEGNKRRATPQVVFRDPVPVDTTLEAASGHYRAILDEVDQAHVLLNALSESSGRAREQARADFTGSLARTQHAVEPAASWLAETVVALAEHLANKVGAITKDFRAVVTCNLDEGPLPETERAQNVAEYEAGLLSKSRAMVRNNVTDPQAELEAIRGEEQLEVTLGILAKRAVIMKDFVAAGATLQEAAIAAGWDEADAKKKFPDRPPAEEANDAAPGFPADDEDEPAPIGAQA